MSNLLNTFGPKFQIIISIGSCKFQELVHQVH